MDIGPSRPVFRTEFGRYTLPAAHFSAELLGGGGTWTAERYPGPLDWGGTRLDTQGDKTSMSETTVVTSNQGSTPGRRVYGGLYSDVASAERGVHRFRDAGYAGDRIGIVSRDAAAKDVAEETGAKAAGGAATGAVAGGVLGGLTGLLVGIGALAIPGIGPVVAGGVLASAFGLGGGTALAGAGIGAAAGGLIGALTGLGFSQDEAKYYDDGVRGGRTLVTVDDEHGSTKPAPSATAAARRPRPRRSAPSNERRV